MRLLEKYHSLDIYYSSRWIQHFGCDPSVRVDIYLWSGD